MIGIFRGLGSSDDFVGLCAVPIPALITKNSVRFLWISSAHEIHENLNPTEIINHA